MYILSFLSNCRRIPVKVAANCKAVCIWAVKPHLYDIVIMRHVLQIHSEASSLCIRLDSQLKNNNITMISSCTKSKQYFNYCFLQMCAKKVSLYPNSVKSLMKNYAEGSTIHGIFKFIVNALVQLINFTHKKLSQAWRGTLLIIKTRYLS